MPRSLVDHKTDPAPPVTLDLPEPEEKRNRSGVPYADMINALDGLTEVIPGQRAVDLAEIKERLRNGRSLGRITFPR